MTFNQEIRKAIQESTVPEDQKKKLLKQLGGTGVRSGDLRDDLGSHPTEDRKGTFYSGQRSGVGKWGG